MSFAPGDGPMYIPVPIKRPGVDVLLILEGYAEGGELICGWRFLAGTIRLGKNALLKAIAEEARKIEAIAKAHGVTEMRHSERDWSRLLPDYEPFPALPNGLRKRLT